MTATSIRFPYLHNGHLRDYIWKNFSHVDDLSKDTWIQNAVNAVQFLHAHSNIHGDISARNFLVADDLSFKLCDFAGFGIGNLSPVVMEEDRYRKSPDSPRSFQTDLFALGCLIFEIMVRSRPYKEISDDDWEMIAERYDRGIFPHVDGLKYGDIIYKCWTSQHTEANQILLDIGKAEHREKERRVDVLSALLNLPMQVLLPLGILPIGIVAFCTYPKIQFDLESHETEKVNQNVELYFSMLGYYLKSDELAHNNWS